MNLGGFVKSFEAAIDKTLGIDGAQADAVLGTFHLCAVCQSCMHV